MMPGCFDAGIWRIKIGEPEWTRTIDLLRVKKEVSDLKPFACFAFPNFSRLQNQKTCVVLVTS